MKLESLFDRFACRCHDIMKCSCVPNDRIPVKEHAFIMDQRNERKMFIGTVDRKFSVEMEKKLQAVNRRRSKSHLVEEDNFHIPITSFEKVKIHFKYFIIHIRSITNVNTK